MLLIFGTRRMRKVLATVMAMCGRCQRPSAHAVVRMKTWFTFFFVPLIPLGTKYLSVCTLCGGATAIDRAEAERLEAAAAEHTAAPVEMTPDGPLSPMPTMAPPGAPAAVGPPPAPPGPGWWLASDGQWYPPELRSPADGGSTPQ